MTTQVTEQPAALKINLNIREIQTLKFSIDNSMKQDSFDKSKLQFGIGVGVRFDPPKHEVSIDTMVDIFCDEQRTSKISESITRVKFGIENFDEVFTVKENQISAPDAVMNTLVSMAVSSTRGMLAAKTEGSILSGVYLPPVDPSSFRPMAPGENATK